MTKEETKERIKVMQAYIKGKEIEVQGTNSEWLVAPEPDWFHDKKYRIKQTPKYRPFKNIQECWQEMQKHRPLGWIKASHGQFSIIGIREDGINFGTSDNWLSYNYIFNEYTFADGTPFGIKE